MAEGYLPLEDVLVVPIVADGGIGACDVEIVAQFGKKELVVCSFGCGGILPSLDERVHEATNSLSLHYQVQVYLLWSVGKPIPGDNEVLIRFSLFYPAKLAS